jgi:CRP/FNR family cyclic AMP-dependent transcriptional regulator
MPWERVKCHSRAAIRVLEEDADLANGLSEAELAEARRVLVAPAVTLRTGQWTPTRGLSVEAGALGVLVLEGLLKREVAIADTLSAELLGPGDLLRPWEPFGDAVAIPCKVRWQVLEDASAALLGEPFAAAAAPWPVVTSALLRRAVYRAHSLALIHAIGSAKRLETRLLLLLWHLANRWGRVRPDGVLLPVPLTHETIAHLIGARRPSVSTALKALERERLVARTECGGWLLPPEPPDELRRGSARNPSASRSGRRPNRNAALRRPDSEACGRDRLATRSESSHLGALSAR